MVESGPGHASAVIYSVESPRDQFLGLFVFYYASYLYYIYYHFNTDDSFNLPIQKNNTVFEFGGFWGKLSKCHGRTKWFFFIHSKQINAAIKAGF